MAESVVLQGHIECNDQHIGNVAFGRGGGFEPCSFELCDHAGGPEQKEAFGLRVFGFDIVDCRQGRGVHLFTRDLNIHLVQFVQVVVDIFGRVVGQERISDTQSIELSQECFCPREES